MNNKYFCLSGCVLNFLILFIFPSFTNAQISRVNSNASQKNRTVQSVDAASLEQRVFEQINQKRLENGLKKLIWSDEVARIARTHSANMANFNFFSHQGLDGKRVDDRADAAGLRKWRMIGENIAYNSGFENPVERAIFGWMNSAGHRQNILRDNWNETGIGVAVSPQGRFYITQVFLKRK